MTATLGDVPKKKDKPEPTAEQRVAKSWSAGPGSRACR
jgi:hypothetical protein